VRENAMGAIVNGMTLSHLRASVATFFNFSDYMPPAMRLGALMKFRHLHFYSRFHRRLAKMVPTHEPVEQLAAYRAMPNMVVFRPRRCERSRRRPTRPQKNSTCTVPPFDISRQAVPLWTVPNTPQLLVSAKGAYILGDAPGGQA